MVLCYKIFLPLSSTFIIVYKKRELLCLVKELNLSFLILEYKDDGSFILEYLFYFNQ